MKFDATNFWDSASTSQLPLSKELISVAETMLGVALPELLLDLLAIQNGGHTLGFIFPMSQKTSWADNYVPLSDMFGILSEPAGTTALNLLDSTYLTEEWGLPEKQVTLTGDGHWFITLDYRQGSIPTVRWIDTELDEDVAVANSFEEFIAGLVLESEFNDATK